MKCAADWDMGQLSLLACNTAERDSLAVGRQHGQAVRVLAPLLGSEWQLISDKSSMMTHHGLLVSATQISLQTQRGRQWSGVGVGDRGASHAWMVTEEHPVHGW